MISRIVITTLSIILIGCGESSEEAYDRGYDDGYHEGWAETCNNIEAFSARINNALVSEDIC